MLFVKESLLDLRAVKEAKEKVLKDQKECFNELIKTEPENYKYISSMAQQIIRLEAEIDKISNKIDKIIY